MATPPSAFFKTIAGVTHRYIRILSDVRGIQAGRAGLCHGAFQTYLHDYITTSAVSFYRPVLSGLVLPHAVFFGYTVGVIESLVGYLCCSDFGCARRAS